MEYPKSLHLFNLTLSRSFLKAVKDIKKQAEQDDKEGKYRNIFCETGEWDADTPDTVVRALRLSFV